MAPGAGSLPHASSAALFAVPATARALDWANAPDTSGAAGSGPGWAALEPVPAQPRARCPACQGTAEAKPQSGSLSSGVSQPMAAGPGFRRAGGGTAAGTCLESFGRELISSRSVEQPSEGARWGNTAAPRRGDAAWPWSRSEALPSDGLGVGGGRAAAPAGSQNHSITEW